MWQDVLVSNRRQLEFGQIGGRNASAVLLFSPEDIKATVPGDGVHPPFSIEFEPPQRVDQYLTDQNT